MAENLYSVDTGGGGSYANLAAAVVAASVDQGGNDVAYECDASTSAADTALVNTAGPTNFGKVTIRPATGQEHPGYYDSSKYRLELTAVGNYTAGLAIGDVNTTVQGMQVEMSDGGYGGGVTAIQGYDASSVIQSSIVKAGTVTGTAGMYGITFSGGNIGENIVYGFASGANTGYVGIHSSSAAGFVYCNTTVNCYTGYETGYQTSDFIDNISQGNAVGYSGIFSGASDFNLSDLTDAPGTNAINSTTLTFQDAANYKYALASTDTAAQGVGQNLYADANYPITVDAVGIARPSAGLFDLGALKYVSGSATLAVNGLNQAQALDSAILTQRNTLAPANTSQPQTLDNDTLTVHGILNPNGINQTQTLDAVTSLIQHNALAPNTLSQSQTLGTVTLTVQGSLSVSNCSQTQTLTLPTLAATYAITPANSSQGQTEDNVTLIQNYNLAVASLDQAQTLDPATLIEHNILVVDSLTQQQIIDGVYFNAAVGWLRGTLVIVASLDGNVTISPELNGKIAISPMLDGSTTIN